MIKYIFTLLIVGSLFYLLSYLYIRNNHYLVNYSGLNGKFGVDVFDARGVVDPNCFIIAKISYVLYYPLHKTESIFHYGFITGIIGPVN